MKIWRPDATILPPATGGLFSGFDVVKRLRAVDAEHVTEGIHELGDNPFG
jgi:hypothetical protein